MKRKIITQTDVYVLYLDFHDNGTITIGQLYKDPNSIKDRDRDGYHVITSLNKDDANKVTKELIKNLYP